MQRVVPLTIKLAPLTLELLRSPLAALAACLTIMVVRSST